MRIKTARQCTRLDTRAKLMVMAESDTKDVLGQYPVTESEVAEFWVSVTPQTGSLLTGRVADTALTKTTHKVTARYRSDISEDMWLIIDNTRYDILYISDLYLRHEILEIFCEVKLNG